MKQFNENHKNQDHRPKNLAILCILCHRMYDLGLIQKEMLLERRDFVETMPEADWKVLMKDATTKAAATRKKNKEARK